MGRFVCKQTYTTTWILSSVTRAFYLFASFWTLEFGNCVSTNLTVFCFCFQTTYYSWSKHEILHLCVSDYLCNCSWRYVYIALMSRKWSFYTIFVGVVTIAYYNFCKKLIEDESEENLFMYFLSIHNITVFCFVFQH